MCVGVIHSPVISSKYQPTGALPTRQGVAMGSAVPLRRKTDAGAELLRNIQKHSLAAASLGDAPDLDMLATLLLSGVDSPATRTACALALVDYLARALQGSCPDLNKWLPRRPD